MGYNKTILEGHLTRDIEMKYAQSGSAIANTAVAVSRKYKAATGEQKEEVLFVDIAMFGRTAEIANQFLRKGSHVLIDGRLKLDQWTAQDGQKRSKISVTVESLQMLGSKEAQPAGAPAPQGGYGQPQPPAAGYGQPAPQTPPPNNQPPAGYQPPPAQPAPTYNQPPAQPPPQGQPAGQPSPQPQPGQPIGYAPNGAPIVINEDEIPF